MDALRIGDEVRDALDHGRAVVALESTIITHGLPAPTNLDVARRVEAAVRDQGAVPATIGLLDGQVRVGLTDDELVRLAGRDDVLKAGSRDLAPLMANGATASTTVGATCVIARSLGIEVFATGGIGGVHHDAATTFDESSDLTDLATTGRIVVSSGIKSVLDVAATCERLETLGVTVVGYGTHHVPGFWVPRTGLRLDHRVDAPDEVRRIAEARNRLGLHDRSIVVMRPVDPVDAVDPEMHDRVVAEALAAADAAGITGKAVTPYVLDAVHRASEGASLRANASLVIGNAALAARIALTAIG
jgi:pseudouridine-5'-phosphate glycosidase